MMTHKIRPSDEPDLVQIMVWLKQEDDEDDGEGFAGFYCNQRIIREAHEEGALTVVVDRDEAVAFMVGDEKSWDILEVRPDMRGRGYGRTLARHYLEQARQNDICVLDIQCSPRTSIPFWKKMGFIMFPYNEETQDRAYMVLNKSFPLPNDLPPVSVLITFYPESKRWDQKTQPVTTYSPDAVRTSTGEILLADRVICFDPHSGLGHDPIISIEVDSATLYLEKIKSDDAEKVGVRCDKRHRFYIDYITPV